MTVYKRCHSCASQTVRGNQKLAPAVKACPNCGGHAFFYGPRMSRALWPDLPKGGPDTITEDGEEIEGEWDRQVSTYTEPRWRRNREAR